MLAEDALHQHPEVGAHVLAHRPVNRDVGVHSHPHGVELVVARHLLDEPATTLVLKNDEVADEVKEATLLKDALEQHLQL